MIALWIGVNYGFISRVLMCNSLNPSHLFKPMHRKVTPNKDRSTIRMTPLYLLFSLYLSATQKNKKKNYFSLDLSLPKIQKLSHTIAQSPWLQLANTVSHTSVTDGVPIHSCLSRSTAGGAIVGAATTGGRRVLLYFSLLPFLFYFSFCFSFYLPSRSDWIP